MQEFLLSCRMSVTVPVPANPHCFIWPFDSQRTRVSCANAGTVSTMTAIARQNFFMTVASAVVLARNLPEWGAGVRGFEGLPRTPRRDAVPDRAAAIRATRF